MTKRFPTSNNSTDEAAAMAAGAFIAIIVLIALFVAFGGWMIMLSIGIVHSIFDLPSRTVSYGEGIQLSVVALLIRLAFWKIDITKVK